MPSTISPSRASVVPPWSRIQVMTAPAAPLRTCRSSTSTPLIRVCAVNSTNVACGNSPVCRSRSPYPFFASTTIDRPSGVSSARLDSCAASASSVSVTPSTGMKSAACRLPSVIVPVLSSSKRVHVTGRLDRATGHREHVALHQPVHAGDADRGQQRADRGRDQADQQRHQTITMLRCTPPYDREGRQRDRRRSGTRSSGWRAGCSARSRSASSAARRPRPARSSGR